MLVSILNAGHGASDPGACANGLIERDINKAVVLKAKEFMQYNGITLETILDTPYVNDVVAKVNEIAKKVKVGIAQSVHMNAGGGDGYEVYHSIFYGQATVFAKILADEFEKTGQNPHSGIGTRTKKSDKGNYDFYGFIRDTIPSAIISEYAFLDNTNDVEQAKQIVTQARAIAKAHCRYYGIEYKEKPDTQHIATTNEKVEMPTGKNITPLGEVGYIEVLPERIIIHYDKYNYISIGKNGIYAYAKDKNCVQII